MAEKRFIGRRITESDRIRQLANEGKLLATTLYAFFLPYLDSSGRMNANPLLLKGGMFEGYDWTVDQLEGAVTDLARVGLIRLYSHGKFGHLIQYEKFLTADGGFNKPHDREPDSDLPGPEEAGSAPVITPERPRTTTSTAQHEDPEPYRTRTGQDPKPSNTTPEQSPAYIEIERDTEIEIEIEPRAHARTASALEQGKKGNRKKPAPRLGDFDAKRITLPEFLDPDRWTAFIGHLEARGKVITEQTAREHLAVLAQHPDDANEMLRIAVASSWVRLFPLDRNRNGSTNSPAAAAWDQILDSARRGKPPDNLDPAAKKALQAIGGWSAVAYCPEHLLGHRRRQFLDAHTTPKAAKT